MKKMGVLAAWTFCSILLVLSVSCNKNEISGKTSDSGKTSRVFMPEELLSSSDASEISGFNVSAESSALSKDPQSGIIAETYKYDINESNTVHGLFQMEENGFKSAETIKKGNTARYSFETEMKFSKAEITMVNNLGDQAFTFNNNGQLHMLYKDYYIIVAFDADAYTNAKNAQLNINLGHRILANLKEKI